MFVRALVAFLVLPVVVAGLVPLFILGGDVRLSKTAVLGVPVFFVGFFALLWCVRDFYNSGKGTLAPWDPPRHLVIVGLYRFVRNPMYIAVLTIVAGWALVFGSIWLVLYLLFLAVVFHLRVLYYEEPWLKRKFDADWENYSKRVPRWLPRQRFTAKSRS